ncbi:hypothetical protein ACN27B_08505 [Micromonospora sp. WMMD754]|uniref:hypothetical protein n=1 Tax=Micromonospora sp. WMMD754 TaxID=3404114 RepID=UPI003BF56F14
MTDLTDFTVTLKMARSTGSLSDEVEHRTFTVTGPARHAKAAEAIAFGLGHGINEASGYAWKFCGGSDSVTVETADETQAELNPAGTASWLKSRVAELTADAARADRLDQDNTTLRDDNADLDRRLRAANAEIASHNKAVTAWAQQVEELKAENAKLRQDGIWEAPAEPADITAVRDRTGQLWVCPGRPGDNLWWRDQLGRGIGYEWHQLIAALGPLTAAAKAEVA